MPLVLVCGRPRRLLVAMFSWRVEQGSQRYLHPLDLHVASSSRRKDAQLGAVDLDVTRLCRVVDLGRTPDPRSPHPIRRRSGRHAGLKKDRGLRASETRPHDEEPVLREKLFGLLISLTKAFSAVVKKYQNVREH